MPLKNELTTIVLVPIKVLLYEDDNGTIRCGRAEWPQLDYVRDCAVQGTNHPHVAALAGKSK